MKLMIAALLSVVGSLSSAVTLHTCVLQNTPKPVISDGETKSTKTVYVVNAHGNIIYVHKTKLAFGLPLVGLESDTYVNDQPEFIFKGNLANGYYESAYDSGTIKCDAGVETPVVYFGSEGTPFPAGQGEIMTSCYSGSAQAAAADVVRIEKFAARDVSIDTYTGTISMTRTEQQCTESRGTGPDDFECLKYAKVRNTYALKNCDYNPDGR